MSLLQFSAPLEVRAFKARQIASNRIVGIFLWPFEEAARGEMPCGVPV